MILFSLLIHFIACQPVNLINKTNETGQVSLIELISVGIGALPLQDESKMKLLSLLESARIASNKEPASYWKNGVADFIIQIPSEKLEYYWHGSAIFTGTKLYISEDAGRLWEQLIASEMPDQDNAKFKTSPNDIIKNFNTKGIN